MFAARLFLGVLLLLTAVFLPADSAWAQNGAGITLKPASIEEPIVPGETKQFVVTVRNENSIEQVFYLSRRDIIGVRDGGIPVYADERVEPTALDMSQWISLAQSSVVIPAGAEVPVSFTVTAPQDASPGSHFAGIFVSAEPPSIEESGASVGYEVANIITMRVAGDVVERAVIRQFSTDNYLYGKPVVSFNVRMENEGNTLIRPSGPVEIINMFGDDVGGGLQFNESLAGVFPGDTREFTLDWTGEGFGFGRYEAIVSAVYGEEGSKQTVSSTVTFWILPLNIIGPALAALAVLLLVVYVGVRLYVRRKLAVYQAMSGRKLVRRQTSGSPVLLVFLVMMVVTALFFIVLLILFA